MRIRSELAQWIGATTFGVILRCPSEARASKDGREFGPSPFEARQEARTSG
jgi:hypothetical protein